MEQDERDDAWISAVESRAVESDLVDVSGLDLAQLAVLPHPALTAALRRIAAEDDAAPDFYARFINDAD